MPSSPSGVYSDDRNHPNHDTIASYQTVENDLTFAEVCARVHGRVEAFLNAEPKTERVRAVQAQTRTSLNVVEEALRKYRYVRYLHLANLISQDIGRNNERTLTPPPASRNSPSPTTAEKTASSS